MRRNIILLVFIGAVLAAGVFAAGTTNVTILYAWNGSEFAPMQIDGTGALKTTLNLTESIGLFPRQDATYDIGKASMRWGKIFLVNMTAAGHINVTGTLSNSTFNGDVRILGTLYGGSKQ